MRLRDEHSIERIGVRAREASCALRVVEGDVEREEPLLGYLARECVRERSDLGELAQSVLGGDFPGGRGADDNLIRRIVNRVAHFAWEAFVAGQPPEERMGVEEEPHGRYFHAASSRFGSGSKNESGTTRTPLRAPNLRPGRR